MHSPSRFFSALITFLVLVGPVFGQWQLSFLTSTKTATLSALAFTISRGSSSTQCSIIWTTSPVPSSWIKCQDTMLRFRITQFTSVDTLNLDLVEVGVNQSKVIASVLRGNLAIGSTNVKCSTKATGVLMTECSLSTPLSISTSSSMLDPAALQITWSLARNDGSASGVTPCTSAWTFYLTDPNVSVLGPLTLGRGTLHEWRTHCDTNWNCGGTDPSVNSWVSCAAPSFQFMKTLPARGDQISNFVMSVKHKFPLMMATSIRGSNAPDYQLTHPDEAAGLDVVLTMADTVWKDGKTLTPITSGGIDQTGDCSTGCEFSGDQQALDVIRIEIV